MRILATAGALAVLAAVWGTSADALTLAEAASPAENPPPGYSRDVYVDSRGCVYVRATIGSTVNWVPRLTSDRRTVVCGMAPTGATAVAAAPPPPPPPPQPPAEPRPAPATAPARAAFAPQPAGPAAPRAVATAPAATAAAMVPATQAAPRTVRTVRLTCPADGSSARVTLGRDTLRVTCPGGMSRAASRVVRLSDGSRVRLLVHPPAPVAGMTAPGQVLANGRVVIGGRPPGAPNLDFGKGYGITRAAPPLDPVPHAAQAGVAATPPVMVPEGYRPAWTDDRLNPDRGPRTAHGDAQMATVFDTTSVPMQPAKPAATRTAATRRVIGAGSQPAAVGRYVQIGAFREAMNVQNALARIRGLGLGGATARTGSGLTLVMAGPFAGTADLQRALATLRAYYPDAYIRG